MRVRYDLGPRQHRRLILLIYADYRGHAAALTKKRIRRALAHSKLGDPGAASNPGRITPLGVFPASSEITSSERAGKKRRKVHN